MKPSCMFAVILCVSAIGISLSGCTHEESIDLDTIVSRSAEAMGYGNDFQDLKTLRFQSRSISSDRVMEWEISRPSFVRKDWDQGVQLVFDGERAAFLAGPRGEDGKLKEAHLVPEEDWHHFEMDVALYVLAYFEYPGVYDGVEEFEGKSAHRISVDLPMGGLAVYLVDVESYLPVSISLPAWEYEIAPGDWAEFNGVMMFQSARSPSHPDHGAQLESIEVNAPIDQSRFAIPETIAALE
ncbi:MAG: hypothetical protein GY906_30300 [bacterium]|nr:hypothetical protein [bacterium]